CNPSTQHTLAVYDYQLISVCEIRDKLTIVFVGFSRCAAERVFRMARIRRSVEASTPADCHEPGGNGNLRFLGLRSPGPIGVAGSRINRLVLHLGVSSCRGVVVAAAVVSTASLSITLAWPPAAR